MHLSFCDFELTLYALLQLVVLSDRQSDEEMDVKRPPIPTLLAVGAVHHHLVRCTCSPFPLVSELVVTTCHLLVSCASRILNEFDLVYLHIGNRGQGRVGG